MRHVICIYTKIKHDKIKFPHFEHQNYSIVDIKSWKS